MQSTPRYLVDPNDPRAPSQAIWDQLSDEERAEIVASLPSEVPLELHPPEGDPHRKGKERARSALDAYFKSIGKRIYVTNELATYYPNEPMFCPDVLAVLDVDDHERTKWVVSDEGAGLDLVIEVYYDGDWQKDYEKNVERYARLGIKEYYLYDRRRMSLYAYHLAQPTSRVYRRIMPQRGRFHSKVLGLDLMLEQDRLRFYHGTAGLFDAEELADKLQSLVRELEKKRDLEKARADEEKARAEAEKARADEEKARADEAKARADEENARAEAEQRRADEEKTRAEAATNRAEEEKVRADEAVILANEQSRRVMLAEPTLRDAIVAVYSALGLVMTKAQRKELQRGGVVELSQWLNKVSSRKLLALLSSLATQRALYETSVVGFCYNCGKVLNHANKRRTVRRQYPPRP